MVKNVILYFEDEEDFREAAKRDLERYLPAYKTIVQEGRRRYDTEGCVNEVLSQIDSLDRVAIVCTDGNLAGYVIGWDVVEELRRRGYEGPAIYTGGNPLPREKAHLYANQTRKFGEELISVVKQYLEK